MTPLLPFIALGIGAALLRHAAVNRIGGLIILAWVVLAIGGVAFAQVTLAGLPRLIEENRGIVAIIGVVFVALVFRMTGKVSPATPRMPRKRAPRVSRREPMTVIVSHEPTQAELRRGDR